MAAHVVLREGLLDEQEPEGVETRELAGVPEGVGRVRVHLEQDLVPEPLAHRAHRFDVPPGLDLQLDPQVAGLEVPGHLVEQLGDGRGDADRHPRGDTRALRS